MNGEDRESSIGINYLPLHTPVTLPGSESDTILLRLRAVSLRQNGFLVFFCLRAVE